MGYIPKDAKWYIAEMIEEFLIEGEPDNIVHVNMVLVRADSPEEAYTSAIRLGQDEEMSYTNPQGKCVTIRFRGLRDLLVIHGELNHGTELVYEKSVGVPEQILQQWVSSKKDLGVFRPMDAPTDSEETTSPGA